ncbi:SIS domain-containing protein [Bifidobacterium sp. ESL0728]|uniref:SIS domain-containing protein n=1 Tax=Bifidobacterium sp. ESL0728 TaxID=2983220 RepID=UPI0023F99585|nr:SIS domain-containing protein [Bifidobacterium sp. ESL0728]WEV59816.1 SIS domain-containing protein [Bifidobacterium sp. ESL0728]
MAENNHDNDIAEIKNLIRGESKAVADLEGVFDDSFEKVVDMVSSAQTVLTTAVGNSGAIASRMAHVLALCGAPAFYLNSDLALHGSVGAVKSGDVIIAVSKGGVTDEVNDFVKLSLDAGAKVVAVTQSPESPLANMATMVQALPHTDADPEGYIGMGTSLAQAAWGDALALAIHLRRGENAKDIASRHPAGLVGKLSRSV